MQQQNSGNAEKADCHAEPKPDCHRQSQLSTERNRYFTGKYMTARDFRDEQSYFLSHHRWHQWTLHGWGIVWGLQVTLIDDSCLRIEPGMAIDCHGRELILSHAVQFPVNDVLKNGEEESKCAAQGKPDQKLHDLLIGLRFNTIERDPVPVLLDDECRSGKNTHNRIQEFAEIYWQKYSPECWDYPRSHLPAHLPEPIPHRSQQEGRKDCSGDTWTLQEHNNPDECGCSQPPVELKPPCECGECGFVPLARLQQDNGGWKTDDLGCRYVQSPFYGEALTHIVGINWNHGGKTCFQHLINNRNDDSQVPADSKFAENALAKCQGFMGRIIIEFDRPLGLKSIEEEGSATFSTYFAQLLKLEYVELNDCHGDHDLDGDDPPMLVVPKHFHLSSCRHKLYCDFPARRVNHDLPVRMRLTLNCDMIVDQRGRAVDGDHLGGQVPNIYPNSDEKNHKPARSGNGVEGGVFYSWTELTPSQK